MVYVCVRCWNSCCYVSHVQIHKNLYCMYVEICVRVYLYVLNYFLTCWRFSESATKSHNHTYCIFLFLRKDINLKVCCTVPLWVERVTSPYYRWDEKRYFDNVQITLISKRMVISHKACFPFFMKLGLL